MSEEPQVGLRLSKVDLRRQLLRYAFARIPRNVSLCFQATVDGFPSHFRPMSYSAKGDSCLGCRWESRGPAVASVVVNHPGSSSIHPLLSICLCGAGTALGYQWGKQQLGGDGIPGCSLCWSACCGNLGLCLCGILFLATMEVNELPNSWIIASGCHCHCCSAG